MPTRALPELKPGQDWCCGGCGSGIVKAPKRTHFEYSREEFPNGDVISKTTVRYVAPCCGGDLLLWDEGKQDCVPWEYAAAPAAPDEGQPKLQASSGSDIEKRKQSLRERRGIVRVAAPGKEKR